MNKLYKILLSFVIFSFKIFYFLIQNKSDYKKYVPINIKIYRLIKSHPETIYISRLFLNSHLDFSLLLIRSTAVSF